ncbi:MAG TPA: class I SAM-dependent methyltransferase, partial [Bacteroidia bacterium]
TLSNDPQTRVMREFAFRIIRPYLSKEFSGLELGCSDGYFSEMLAAELKDLDVVDGSLSFVEEARKRGIPNANYFHSLFEEYNPGRQYDCIFASYIMEHVMEPKLILEMVLRVLKPGGIFYVVVPNARALSRQLAMHMGLYKDLKQLTENDLKYGHRRVYDRVTLNREVESAGFTTISQGGIMLKILADFQMDKLISTGILQEPQLNGLLKLGYEYPDLCGSLFSICKRKEDAGNA